MLMKSGINPFDSQETKPYKNDPEILAMTNLVRYVRTVNMLIAVEQIRRVFDDWRIIFISSP